MAGKPVCVPGDVGNSKDGCGFDEWQHFPARKGCRDSSELCPEILEFRMGRRWPSEIRFEQLLDLFTTEPLATVLLFSEDFDLSESMLAGNLARRPVNFVRVGPDDRLGTSVLG